jgi:hypothetical protein
MNGEKIGQLKDNSKDLNMTYYITGIDTSSGNKNDDSSDLLSYYELGWEIMTTHLKLKELLHDGYISDNDVIVTCSGREFLYQKSFKNVITWKDYLKINHTKKEVNLCQEFSSNHSLINEITPKKDDSLIDLFFSFEKEENLKFNTDGDFVCMVYRNRDHGSHRNMDIDFFKKIIDFLKYKFNLNIFVVGFGSEIFEDNKNVFSVNLKEFTTLINNDNCKLCVSSLTGPSSLTYLFGGVNLKNIIIDIESARKDEYMENHPLAMGNLFNYKNVESEFILGMPDEVYLFNKINNILNKN